MLRMLSHATKPRSICACQPHSASNSCCYSALNGWDRALRTNHFHQAHDVGVVQPRHEPRLLRGAAIGGGDAAARGARRMRQRRPQPCAPDELERVQALVGGAQRQFHARVRTLPQRLHHHVLVHKGAPLSAVRSILVIFAACLKHGNTGDAMASRVISRALIKA